MSLDIDWALLSGPSTPGFSTQPIYPLDPSSSSSSLPLPEGFDPSPALSESLIASLNEHLASASRPSFIGPISISSFDFGSVGPDVEITDIRDVWRAFDEGDDEAEGDELLRHQRVPDEEEYTYGYDDEVLYEEEEDQEEEDVYGRRRGVGGRSDGSVAGRGGRSRRMRPTGAGIGQYRQTMDGAGLDDESYDLVSPLEARGGQQHGRHARSMSGALSLLRDEPDDFDDNVSVYSGMSPRNSVIAVGIGVGGNTFSGLGGRGVGGGIIDPSLFSAPLSSRIPRSASRNRLKPFATSSHLQHHQSIRDRERLIHRHSPISSPPPSPPARPHRALGGPTGAGGSSGDDGSSSVPSLQLHVRIAHKSDLHLTLLTSLQVNYPSPLFMSLPLKLSITGLALNADLVLAYSGAKNRVHITIIDEEDQADGHHHGQQYPGSPSQQGLHRHAHEHPHQYLSGAAAAAGRKPHVPIGERLLPNLQIESEIGHTDAHVLRNVGKVERFIVEAVRKTLVDELVFPNFQTVAL